MFSGERASNGRRALLRSLFMMRTHRRPAANFKKLVQEGFYKKTTIHRVFPNYLVQGGDPLSKKKDRTVIGTGGPGYTLRAEIRRKHLRGSVAMGRLPDNVNPNSSIQRKPVLCLPSADPRPGRTGHRLRRGDCRTPEALDEISRLPADSNANPLERVEVTRAYIVDRSQLGHPAKV